MTKKNRRNLIIFCAGLLLLIVALVAVNMFNRGPVHVAESEAIQADPISLYTSYLTDSAAAHKTYDGKIVRLTGEVSGVTENMQKQQVILIKTSATGGNINCTMEKPTAGIKQGSTITVKGICSGLGQGDAELGIAGDVYLRRAVLAD